MLYKISMVFALGCIAAAGVFNEIKVNTHIKAEENARDAARAKEKEEKAAYNKANTHLTQTVQDQAKLDNDLAQANQLNSQRAQEVVQTRNAEQAADSAKRAAKQELDDAYQSNEDYKNLGMEIAEIRRIVNKLPKVERALSTAIKERDLITKNNKNMRAQIQRLAPPHKKPLLPHGLRGKVMSYDPKYQYVVLDLGKHHGALKDGELMISRDGSLLGKIKITRVEDDYSIANVLQDWKTDEPAEGDLVIYRGL